MNLFDLLGGILVVAISLLHLALEIRLHLKLSRMEKVPAPHSSKSGEQKIIARTGSRFYE